MSSNVLARIVSEKTVNNLFKNREEQTKLELSLSTPYK